MIINGQKFIRVRFADGESGWAEDLGDDTCKIANIPVSHGYNIDDVVECCKGVEKAALGKVLKRGFECKTGIRYSEPHADNFVKLHHLIQEAGGKVEGLLPGLALVAHNKLDLQKLCDDVGIEIEIQD